MIGSYTKLVTSSEIPGQAKTSSLDKKKHTKTEVIKSLSEPSSTRLIQPKNKNYDQNAHIIILLSV